MCVCMYVCLHAYMYVYNMHIDRYTWGAGAESIGASAPPPELAGWSMVSNMAILALVTWRKNKGG